MRFHLEAYPMHWCRTVDDCLCHMLKQLEGTAVPISCRRYSPDLRNTYLDMGVTVPLECPKAWSGPPDTFGHDTAKPLEGETTMHAEALPPDINPESRCSCRYQTATTSTRQASRRSTC